jgi:excisionase family DNA binding protein
METLLTTAEVAALLNVHENTVHLYRKHKGLKSAGRVGRRWRWRREDVDRFLAGNNAEQLAPKELAEIKQQAAEGAKS